MTRFEELTDIIDRNKNRKKSTDVDPIPTDIELEVSGTESTLSPLTAWANDETDPDLIDQLYRSHRIMGLEGYFPSDYDVTKVELAERVDPGYVH